ncbi:Histone-lysine N-methyltransferase EZH1 [Leucoagaricus sp. SymC.cos]|nr:Histone-lysine N-methyltransferase EZH1 [Leucoagaricus sp. SymC.cos]
MDVDVEQNIPSIVTQVYRANWESFYAWKAEDTRKSMASLCVSNTKRCEADISHSDDDESSSDIDPDEPAIHVTEYTYDSESDDPKPSTTYALPVCTTIIKGPDDPTFLRSYPAYSSTAPLRRSIYIGDDLNPLPFIPFSDDPEFDHIGYINDHYDSFSWQDLELQDPDIQVICVQTVKELMSEKYGLMYEEIVETGVMPKRFVENMLSFIGARSRDYPAWPPEAPLHHTNVPYKPPYDTSPEPLPSEVLADLLKYFCISDCLHGYCNTHSSEKRPLPQHIPPTLTNESLYLTVEKPCSKYCFVLGKYARSLPYWSAEDIDILHITLAYSPDTLPCDLSTIVRKPCNEVRVAARRHEWLASHPIASNTGSKQPTAMKKMTGANRLEFADFDSDNFTPNPPCTHPGPCTSSNPLCTCAHNNAHCIGACDCSPKTCVRKWRGCSCNTKGSRTCGTDRCPCFRAHRECDPVLCVKCESRDPTTDICKNASLQHMRHKRGIVHRGKWGLGYYILEAAREGDLITEYVGDLIYEPTVRSRDPVSAHTQRQYMFKLNATLSVDGTTTGNESRYINHASGEKANVRAHVRLTGSEHRIGIFACRDIEPGTELLLDYGDDFFSVHATQPPPQTHPRQFASSRTQSRGQAPFASRKLVLPKTPGPLTSQQQEAISESPLILSASFLRHPHLNLDSPLVHAIGAVASSSHPQSKQQQPPTPPTRTRAGHGARSTRQKGIKTGYVPVVHRGRKRRRGLTDLSGVEDGEDEDESEYRASEGGEEDESEGEGEGESG